MPLFSSKAKRRSTPVAEAVLNALDQAQAIISFGVDGTILEANENFLAVVGYTSEEIVGQHHRIFVDPSEVESRDYEEFWNDLAKGKHSVGEFVRRHKSGKNVVIEASYNPVSDDDGNIIKIVKIAFDVTAKRALADGKDKILQAVSRSQSVVEFEPDGTIIEANQTFLELMGYSADEVIGKNHSMFCSKGEVGSARYQHLWSELMEGKAQVSEFQRFGKNGKLVWFQASCHPVLRTDGTVEKVIKIANDITAAKLEAADNQSRIDAITRSLAVLECDLDGTILSANEKFLEPMGYSLDEVLGKKHADLHHDADNAQSEYQEISQGFKEGKSHAAMRRMQTKDGADIWWQSNFNPVCDQDGEYRRAVFVAADSPEWKQELDAIIKGLGALARGDLKVRLPATDNPDFRDMRQALNDTIDKLSELVADIDFTASAIKEESDAISESARDLSSRCESQASTLEETSAAMEQMSSTVKSNAENAEKATTAAENATSHAEQGGQIVEDAIAAMSKIEEGSLEIRKIIEVIDAIAFQTNLLALNAGVEAARAGEAGSGFAVVASEVRALAQRASDSARDISALIETSEKQVAEGASLVQKTGDALGEIVTAVGHVSGGISEIFTASREQEAGVDEINQAISDVDSTTQKTVAISEKNTSAAISLAQRASALRELVSFFSVEPTEYSNRASETAEAFECADLQPVPARKPVVEQTTPVGSLAMSVDIDEDDWREF